jgi:hypothetical protein
MHAKAGPPFPLFAQVNYSGARGFPCSVSFRSRPDSRKRRRGRKSIAAETRCTTAWVSPPHGVPAPAAACSPTGSPPWPPLPLLARRPRHHLRPRRHQGGDGGARAEAGAGVAPAGAARGARGAGLHGCLGRRAHRRGPQGCRGRDRSVRGQGGALAEGDASLGDSLTTPPPPSRVFGRASPKKLALITRWKTLAVTLLPDADLYVYLY